MYKRSLEDGPAAVRRSTRHAEPLRDRMKLRLEDDPSKRNLKAQSLKVSVVALQGQDVVTRSTPASSLKVGQAGQTANITRLEESSSVGMNLKRPEHLTVVQSVELEAKATQTKDNWEEKGLQISMGRHVTRAPPVLAVSGSQTSTPALVERLKERVQGKRTHLLFYLAVSFLSFLTVLLGFHFGGSPWAHPGRQPPLREPTIWKSIFSSVGRLLQNCCYCPAHR